MKKLVLSLITVVMISMLAISCGPSAKKLEEKRVADSIAATVVDSTQVDSTIIVTDTLAK
jgi:hypothetical protein